MITFPDGLGKRQRLAKEGRTEHRCLETLDWEEVKKKEMKGIFRRGT
jgi:hypothetical protein